MWFITWVKMKCVTTVAENQEGRQFCHDVFSTQNVKCFCDVTCRQAVRVIKPKVTTMIMKQKVKAGNSEQ
jgi:hypothetical protein